MVPASIIDHTLLRPDASRAEVAELCAEAIRLGAAAVCVAPTMLPLPELDRSPVAVCTVVGFPSGAHRPEVKAAEAAAAVAAGADEIDMVVNLGAVRAGDRDLVAADIAAVRAACPGRVLKVIVESAALSADELQWVCELAVAGGADFLKTSTGFHPAGGATVDAVAALARVAAAAGRPVGVKASGGIRTAADAAKMVAAGATRLGCSSTAAVVAESGAAGEDPVSDGPVAAPLEPADQGTAGDAASPGSPTVDWGALEAAARAAAVHAYAPYSGHAVGASVLAGGRVFSGANVENAAYLAIHAEWAALSAAVAAGESRIDAVLCVTGSEDPQVAVPCGLCRQVLFELGGPDLQVAGPAGPRRLAELLPDAFGPAELAEGTSR